MVSAAACSINHALTLPAENHTTQCWAEYYCHISDWPPRAQCSFGMSGATSGLNKVADSTGVQKHALNAQ